MKIDTRVAVLLSLVALVTVNVARAQDTAADSAWAAGNHDVAERMYAARLAADSNDVMALRRIATLRAWAARYDESIALFDRAARLAPNDAKLGLERARVLAWDRRYTPAIQAIDALLEQDPANRELLEARAQFASWAGRLEESLQTYGKLLEITPDDPALRHAAARVMGWARQYDAAVTEYNRLLASKPGDRELTLGLAQVLLWGGRADSAKVIFQGMLERDERDLDAIKGLARAASWSGDLRTGEKQWRRVHEVAPDDIEGLIGLGAVLRWQGRDAAAIELLQRAAEIDSTNADVRVQLPIAKAALAPRFAPSFTYEEDSDGNSIRTVAGSIALRATAPVEVRLSGYQRALRGPNLAGGTVENDAYGATGGLTLHLDPGWTLSGSIGGSKLDRAGADVLLSGRVGVGTPRWLPVTATVAYARTPFDYTAILAERRIYTEQLAIDAAARLATRWNASLSGAVTSFEGTESNRQVSGGGTLTYRLMRALTTGISVRAFGFEKDRSELLEGYFNPDFYGIVEATASAYLERGGFVVSADAAPGVQRIGSDGDTSGSFRTTVRLAYALGAGRQIGISGAYANSGLQQLSSLGTSQYSYKAVNLFTTWTF